MELTKCSSEDRGSRESRSHNRWLDIDEAFLAQLREALEPEEKWRYVPRITFILVMPWS